MSSDKLKRKTVCLKLAKNGIYLCKNPSKGKVMASREVALGSRQLKDQNQLPRGEADRMLELPFAKSNKMKKEAEEESVLQKFIRGFDCGDLCDDNLCSGFSAGSSNVGSNPAAAPSQDHKKSISTLGSQPQCRVEFVTPVKMGDIPSRENVKAAKPLIVDLSQKKLVLKDNPIKIVKSTPKDLRQLNRNFITPKVKVENFSQSESSSLPLIISPAQTPNFSASSSNSPYPSTKIEIDYTGSSIQDDRYIDPHFPQPIKSEIPEYTPSPKMIFGQDGELCVQDSDGFDDAYRNFNNMIQQQSYWNNMDQNHGLSIGSQQSSNMNLQPTNLNMHGSDVQPYSLLKHEQYNNMPHDYHHNNSLKQSYHMNHPTTTQGWNKEADVLKAAKALYSKRTRTLFHWINPNMPKNRLKDSVNSAWYHLPSWQKQIYINQVIGKCGGDGVSPMVNPQILEINGMAQVVMPSMKQAQAQEQVQPARKKRKYTRKCSALASSNATTPPSLPSLSPTSTFYNFFSSL